MKTKQILHNSVFFSSFLLTAAIIFKLLNSMNMGVDLTDEGYYFNWISNPWLYKYYASQFGYVYHPVYKALGNSIINLRQFNLLFSYGLSCLLSYCVLSVTLKKSSIAQLMLASACLALPALFILMITGYWVPSPSYNSLNFQGCLIVALGFVVSQSPQFKSRLLLASFLIGLGGWLVFMAKPSTAIGVAVISLLFYLPSIKRDWRILLGAALLAILLLIASACWIDGSVVQFVKRYQGGLLLLKAMNSGHGLGALLKLDLLPIDKYTKLFYGFLVLLIVLAFYVQSLKNNQLKLAIYGLLALLLAMAAYCWANFLVSLNFITPKYHIFALASLLIATGIYCFKIPQSRQAKLDSTDANGPGYALILGFLAMPYVYAMGTNNNYWLTGAGAMLFWLLTAILLLAKKRVLNIQLPIVIVVTLVIVSINLFISAHKPYRQSEAIFKQSVTYVDPHSQQTLVLATDTAKYLNTLREALHKTKFQPNAPMIDLTGHHPGTLYFMQAKSIGQAWTIGGYKGSEAMASMALYQASCEEIASAWLLIEKDGRRQIPHTMLISHGIQADKTTYQKMAKFDSQQLFKTHPKKVFEQYLLKPIDINNQTKACLAYRKAHLSPFQ